MNFSNLNSPFSPQGKQKSTRYKDLRVPSFSNDTAKHPLMSPADFSATKTIHKLDSRSTLENSESPISSID